MSWTMRYTSLGVPPMNELSARGQICALGVSSNVVFPGLAVKKSDCRLEYCAGVMRSKPVVLSGTAPVAAR